MSLQNLKVWVSPLTGTIYAGYFNKNAKTARSKKDITDAAIAAVMQKLDKENICYTCDKGTLKWEPREETNTVYEK